jgi:tetratricopeptide (TPR) repeat protein
MNLDFDNIEFQTALELIQETNLSFFLTGKAGTGKSTFLKHIVNTVSKNFVVVAPTGIAAVNVSGVTLHSFFQFPLRPLLPQDEDIKIFWKNSEKRKIISAMDTLIIDEISMVRADLIDGIDYSLRRNGGNPNLPFGGKQIVFVGDIFQLEPVTIKNSGEQEIIREIYSSPYFYNAKVFEKVNLFTIELQKVYRQRDSSFITLLDKVRTKEITSADIDKINTRVFSQAELNNKDFAITLTTKNDLADTVNSRKLGELKKTPFNYTAEVSGEFEESKYPTEPDLILKEGAQVIFIKNDTDKRWVNGTIGQVSELTDSDIKVKLEDGSIHSVEKRVWENIKYQYNKEKKKIEQETVGTFKQYPLKLAWAITIHKSQGLTFERIVIDFGTGTFASGQAYVALSRATTFDGLFLKQKMHTTDILIDSEIIDFSKSFNNPNIIQVKLNEGKNIYSFLKTNDLDSAGKYYLKLANKNIIQNDFLSAYNNIIKGFDYVVCDCVLGGWTDEGLIETINQFNTFNCNLNQLNLILGYAYWHNNEFDLALGYIDNFILQKPNNELGYYLKGRIFVSMNKFDNALEFFNMSLSIKKTNRTLYRIGRVKEEHLDKNGISELYEASINCPISHCSGRLSKYANQRGIYLPNNSSFFTESFNKGGNIFFYYSEIRKKIKLENGNELDFLEEMSKFLKSLIINRELFY